MRKFLLTCALLAATSTMALGVNATTGTLNVQNANSNTGACTASSCLMSALQVSAGTIFSATWAVQNTVSVNVAGTFSATLTFQASYDEGATWNNTPCLPTTTTATNTVPAPVVSTTSTGNWVCNVAGATTFRTVASTFSTGSPVVIQESYAAAGAQSVSSMPPVVPGPSATVGALGLSRQVAAPVEFKHTQGTVYSINAQNTIAAAACLQVWCSADAGQQLNGVLPDLAIGMASSGVISATFPVGACGGGTGITIAAANTCDGGTNGANTNATNVAITYQ